MKINGDIIEYQKGDRVKFNLDNYILGRVEIKDTVEGTISFDLEYTSVRKETPLYAIILDDGGIYYRWPSEIMSANPIPNSEFAI